MRETMEVSERLFRYLLEDKGKRIQEIQQGSHGRVRMERSPCSVVVSGTKEAVEAAIEGVKRAEKELKEATVEMEVSGAQMEMLLDKKGALMKKIEKEQKCRLDVDRKTKKVLVLAPETSREEALGALKALLDSVRVETVSLKPRQAGLFVGVKGSNIMKMRETSGAQLEVEKDTLRISGEETAVKKAMELVQKWLEEHVVMEMESEASVAFAVVVGPKGANRKVLEKELGVELSVEDDKTGKARITVLGSAPQCESAVNDLQNKMEQYKKENVNVSFPGGVLQNAPELRRSSLEVKMKELGVEMSMMERRGVVTVHGAEESLQKAVEYLEEVKRKYEEYEEREVKVAKGEIGILVGRGGENVRRLQDKLGVVVVIDKGNEKNDSNPRVRVWGPKEKVEAGCEGVIADLEERVQVSESIPCSVKQISRLTENRFAVINEIEEQSGAEVDVPRELPVFGSTAVTVRGNKREVERAVPLVREALQGLVRKTLRVRGEHVCLVLKSGNLQLQRLTLESKSRIMVDEEKGEVTVVGPKEGVELVLRRFLEQLRVLLPEEYLMESVAENVSLGLSVEKNMKEMERYMKEHGVEIYQDVCGVYVYGPSESLPEAKEWLKDMCERVSKENAVVSVPKECISFLIGTRGNRISQMRKVSGSSLDIIHDNAVWIQGKEECVMKGVELVSNALEEYEATHRRIQIDPEYIGVLVGARGSNLSRLRQRFLTTVSVDDDGWVSVSGAQKQAVEDTIAEIVKYLEEKKQEMGSEKQESEGRREFKRHREESVEEKTKEKVSQGRESVWEKLKHNPQLPVGMSKKKEESHSKEVSRILGLKDATVGGSDCYKSESGYTVEL